MIKRFDNVKISPAQPESDLLKIAEKKLGAKVKYFKIIKKSLDARDKRNVFWTYSIACSAKEEVEPKPAFERIINPPVVAVMICTPKVRHFRRCIFLCQEEKDLTQSTRQNSR